MERVDSLVLFLISVKLFYIFLLLVQCWLLACYILPSLHLGMFLVPLVSPRSLSWKGVGFCWRFFQHLMRSPFGFFLSVCLYGRLHWQFFFVCCTICVFMGCSLLDHGGWCFLCVLRLCLLVVYWVFFA